MTVLLAYASPPEVLIIAVCLLVALVFVVVALWPELRAEYRIKRRPAPPRPTRTVSIEITPRLHYSRIGVDPVAATAIAYAQTGRPRSHLRTLGPRPFDWSIDDPELAVAPRGAFLGEVFVAPVGTVIDETFPHGPNWSSLGRIDGDSRSFLFETTTAKRP